MTDTDHKTGAAEALMLMLVPAATVHIVCTSFGLSFAFPFKIYIGAVLAFCLADDIRSRSGPFAARLRSYASSLRAAEIVAFAAAILAIFGAWAVNRHPGAKSLNEAGGFLLAVMGIGSFLRRVNDPVRFAVRMLQIIAALAVVQCVISAIHCRAEVFAAVSGSVTAVDYIKTSWKASFLYSNPNSFGFYMMAGGSAAWALAVRYLLSGERRRFAASVCAAAVCAFGILLSASRASMFGFGVAVAFTLCLPPVLKAGFSAIRRRPVKSALLAAVFVAACIFLFHNYIDTFTRKFDNGTIYRSAFWSQLFEDPSRHGAIDVVTASRYSFWRGFLAQQAESFPSADFFFGRGNFRPINPVDPGMELHNVYLEIWGKYGLFCAAALAVFLVLCVRKACLRREFVFLAGVGAAFMLHGCFEDKIFVNSLHPQLLYLYTALLVPVCAAPPDGKTRVRS